MTIDDPEVFTDFVRNNLRVTTQQKNDVITNFVESFWYLLAVNDGYIDTFIKYNHSTKNSRASAKIILISNNVS